MILQHVLILHNTWSYNMYWSYISHDPTTCTDPNNDTFLNTRLQRSQQGMTNAPNIPVSRVILFHLPAYKTHSDIILANFACMHTPSLVMKTSWWTLHRKLIFILSIDWLVDLYPRQGYCQTHKCTYFVKPQLIFIFQTSQNYLYIYIFLLFSQIPYRIELQGTPLSL